MTRLSSANSQLLFNHILICVVISCWWRWCVPAGDASAPMVIDREFHSARPKPQRHKGQFKDETSKFIMECICYMTTGRQPRTANSRVPINVQAMFDIGHQRRHPRGWPAGCSVTPNSHQVIRCNLMREVPVTNHEHVCVIRAGVQVATVTTSSTNQRTSSTIKQDDPNTTSNPGSVDDAAPRRKSNTKREFR